MSSFSIGVSRVYSSIRSRHAMPYLLLPGLLLAVVSFVAFRPAAPLSLPAHSLSTPLVLPQGWSAPPVPANNPITTEKFTLGRQLFYETMLSGDGKTSCSSCHQQQHAFASPIFPDSGAFGNFNSVIRRVPRIVNVAYDTVLFWDGHANTLEEQVHLAIVGHGDLDADTSVVIANLAENPAYTALFNQAFGDPAVTVDRIAMAIATFERCLISGNSPYDQYLNGNTAALSASAQRGMTLFFDTANHCSDCHTGMNLSAPNAAGNLFTDNNYYRTGTFDPPGGYGGPGPDPDSGREDVTHDTIDLGRFRTPTLRNVALSAPYGADGTVSTLEEVIQHYNNGGNGFIIDRSSGKDKIVGTIGNQDPRITPLNLNQGQQQDLLAFLQSLTDTSFVNNPDFQDPGPLSIVIDGHVISGNLSVFPNPSTDLITVQCPNLNGTTQASLISETGATVWHRTITTNGQPFQLDLTGVANGAYRLELQAGGVSQASKIVLQR